MTLEVPKNEWKHFFDEFSKEKLNWETTVQVLNSETGAQILSDGLPFQGLTFEDNGDTPAVELTLGHDPEHHQTHNVFDPRIIAFEERADGGTLDIEDAAGTKTLVTFVQPMKQFANG